MAKRSDWKWKDGEKKRPMLCTGRLREVSSGFEPL